MGKSDNEEQILVDLVNNINKACELLSSGASCANGESHFSDERLEEIDKMMIGWSLDIMDLLKEGKYS